MDLFIFYHKNVITGNAYDKVPLLHYIDLYIEGPF